MGLTYQGPGERIDIWLTKQFPYTRSFFHHIIARGGIQIHGKPVKKSYILKKGDEIHVDDLQRYLSSEILEETPNINISIIKEEDDYLVINKPKGVLSHPRNLRELSEPSVVGFLYHRYKKLPSVGNFIRAGLIHRLDKETDGLMIIAKTEKGLAHFKKLFQKKSEIPLKNLKNKNFPESSVISGNPQESSDLRKFYRANCHITPEGEKFLHSITELPYTISEPVHAKIPYTTPKLGITKILEIKKMRRETGDMRHETGDMRYETGDMRHETCNIILEILTGRTHQIRYHLAHYGLPIVGDYLYGKDEGMPMQLTAHKLIFRDPENEVITVEI